jgi:hypothetical protein
MKTPDFACCPSPSWAPAAPRFGELAPSPLTLLAAEHDDEWNDNALPFVGNYAAPWRCASCGALFARPATA